MAKIEKTSWFWGLGLPVVLLFWLWLWPICAHYIDSVKTQDKHGTVVSAVESGWSAPMFRQLIPSVTMNMADSASRQWVKKQAISQVNLNGVDAIAYQQMTVDVFFDAHFEVKPFIHSFVYQFPDKRIEQHPFKVFTEVVDSPWHDGAKVLTVSLKADDAKKVENQHWVFLVYVDLQETNQYGIDQQVMSEFANRLKANDSMAIVTYGDGAVVRLPLTLGQDRDKVGYAITHVVKQPNTVLNQQSALDLAYAQLPQTKKKMDQYTVIWLPKDNWDVGYDNFEALKGLIAKQKQTGVELSVWDSQVWPNINPFGLAKQLSNVGQNRFVHLEGSMLNQSTRIPYLVQDQMQYSWQEVAQNTQLNIHFDENVVESYRTITQEKQNQYGNVDESIPPIAANSRSGQQVIAMYELYLTPSALKQLPNTKPLHYAQVNVQYQIPESQVQQSFSVPIQRLSLPLSHANVDNRLAIAVAGLAQKMAGVDLGRWQMIDGQKALQQVPIKPQYTWVPMLIARIDKVIDDDAMKSNREDYRKVGD